jgi:DNA-directed RNA polymerase subunit beta'
MMAPHNIFSPSSGKPDHDPDPGHYAGCFYLTVRATACAEEHDRLMLFGTKSEVIFAHLDGALRTHDRVRLSNPDFGKNDLTVMAARKIIETTVGRVLFSEIWPDEMGFPNFAVNKSRLGDIIMTCYKTSGMSRPSRRSTS